MNDATVRFRKPGDSPDSRGGTGFGLPADLLSKSRKRVRLVGLFVLLGVGLDLVQMLAAIAFGGDGAVQPTEAVDLLPLAGSVTGAASAAAIVFASRSARVRDTALLRAALVFEVFLCLNISLTNPVSVFRETGALPQLTWVTPLIILFPLVVPCPPRLTVITAILAAATRPLGLVILERSGIVETRGGDYFAAVYSGTLAVVFAYFGSRVVYSLGREVAEARRLGSYSLERLLGRGGMGEVWLGRHSLLARPAAVKLLRSDLAGVLGSQEAEVMRERFEREAQATAALRSPHTINLYDFGVSEDGTFYYVMELLEGVDADSLVRRFGLVPPERAVHILRDICHSLAEAHEAGLIHRDIKPANIFLCRYGRELDFVKVLDFGLVKAVEEPERDTGLTMDGTVRGTPSFMAPEQARGGDGVDARADIYAVGCVAYWLLTGQRVFDGATTIEVLMHHVGTPATLPSRRTELPIPPELERVVMDCLEKDPARRPSTPLELSERLAKCPLREPWTQEKARRWWSMHLPDGSASDGSALL